MPLVDHVEVVDIQNDSIHRRFPVVDIILVRIVIEVVTVVKTGKLVSLSDSDGITVLVQLDGTLDSCVYYTRVRIRLRYEIYRSEAETLDLSLPVGSRYDNRKISEPLVALHYFEDIKTVHVRHDEVEQDYTQSFVLFLHYLYRFGPGAGIYCLVLIAEDVSEHLSVDHLVIDDQYAALAVHRMEFYMAFWHSCKFLSVVIFILHT